MRFIKWAGAILVGFFLLVMTVGILAGGDAADEEPGEAQEQDEEAETHPEEEPEEAEARFSIAGSELRGAGVPSGVVCQYYADDVVDPALDGQPDDVVRVGLEETLVDASFMEDTTSNRLLYEMLEEMAEAWDNSDVDGVSAVSDRLSVRCSSELQR